MKKFISVILMLGILLANVAVYAEDIEMNAELSILTDRQSLNLSEIGEFKLTYVIDNKSLTERINGLATYTLCDENSDVLWIGEGNVTVSANGTKKFEIVGNVSKYGVNTLKIDIKDKTTGKILTGEAEVSLSKNNHTLNPDVGVSAHFAWNSNPNSTIPYLKKMGAGFVRDEIYWSEYLTADGDYVLPEKADDYVNKLVENGIEPVIILNYSNNGNSAVPSDRTEFNTFLTGFGEYVYNLVSDLKGRVTYFEVWNEMNTIDSGAYGRQYAKMLKIAYEKAKLANPECKIIGPVTAGISNTFFMAMKAEVSNIADYMDILSFHEYGYANIPESADYEATLRKCANTLTSYFGNKEIWLTEMGWAEDYNGITERDAAMYTVRQYLNNSAEKFADKMFIYNWINHQGHSNSYEANLGLLNGNLSAKKGYSAMAAMNNFLRGFELEDVSTDSDNNYTYSYKNGSREVIVLYNADDAEKTVTVSPSFLSSGLYDMYGNKIEDLSGADSYNIAIDGAPKYIVKDTQPAMMDYKTNTAQIHGIIDGAQMYDNVMLYVTKPDVSAKDVLSRGNLVYIEQLRLGEGGSYEFSFPMYKDAGDYNVYIGYGKASTLLGPVKLQVVRDVSGYTEVTDASGKLDNIQDIVNSKFEVKASGIVSNTYNTILEAMFFAAGMKGNRLMWIEKDNQTIKGYGEHTIELTLDKALVSEVDEIRLFLWKEDIAPIVNEITVLD